MYFNSQCLDMLAQNHLILGVLGPLDLKFPWTESGLTSSMRTEGYSKCFVFFPTKRIIRYLIYPRLELLAVAKLVCYGK